MIVWRDERDGDIFHFGRIDRNFETRWLFSTHVDGLEVFGDKLGDLIALETCWPHSYQDVDELRSRVLRQLANEVRDHCAELAKKRGQHGLAKDIKEYKHELGTEDG